MESQMKEFSARTSEEAIEAGLKELGLKREEAYILVLEEGKKKLFGYQKARVKIAPKTLEEDEVKEDIESEDKPSQNENNDVKTMMEDGLSDGERAVEFLKNLFAVMDVEADVKLKEEKEKIIIDVQSEKANEVIGKRGAVIDAVQTLAGAVANIGRDDYKRVVVDCESYRERREATLKKLADNLANKALRTERKICLEPMNPYERRIIHAALGDRTDVTTKSEGKEPNRYVVIIPENASDKPPLAAREERRDRNGRDRNNGRGGRNDRRNGNGRSFNRDRRSGSRPQGGAKRPSIDFFGTFLGNSGDKHED